MPKQYLYRVENQDCWNGKVRAGIFIKGEKMKIGTERDGQKIENGTERDDQEIQMERKRTGRNFHWNGIRRAENYWASLYKKIKIIHCVQKRTNILI
jgi:hypothetical protein